MLPALHAFIQAGKVDFRPFEALWLHRREALHAERNFSRLIKIGQITQPDISSIPRPFLVISPFN